MRIRRGSLARRVFALQALLSVLLLAGVAVAAVLVTGRRDDDDARTRVLGLAVSVAANPFVRTQAGTADPTAALQPYAEAVRRGTGVAFVVIMTPTGIRWTHPDASLIGQRYRGTIGPALAGHAFAETYTGSLGPSVRAVAPVRSGGHVVGLVAVGITTSAVDERLERQLPYLAAGLLGLLAVALAGAALVSARLRRQTGGLDPGGLRDVLAAHEAVLHSVTEGLLVTDAQQRVGLVNDRAARLLGLTGELRGRDLAGLGLPDPLREVIASGLPVEGELHLTGSRLLVVDQAPAVLHGRRHGTVTTLRDRTELSALTGELDASRSLAQALHTQTHESANRLHTVVMLVETGQTEAAIRFGTEHLELSQRLTDSTLAAVAEPVAASLLLGKVAAAAERGVRVDVTVEGDPPLTSLPATHLTTVLGNLVDNAVDAATATGGTGRVSVRLTGDKAELVVAVADDGPGLPPEAVDDAFRRGWSTKLSTGEAGRGLGLALVHQVVRQHGGSVTVSRSELGGALLTVHLPVGAAP